MEPWQARNSFRATSFAYRRHYAIRRALTASLGRQEPVDDRERQIARIDEFNEWWRTNRPRHYPHAPSVPAETLTRVLRPAVMPLLKRAGFTHLTPRTAYRCVDGNVEIGMVSAMKTLP
ncbi:MAG: hypothetical protein C7B45_05920 [Sulfobacillus acidophilus]|uniref:Uncharacterized protein n=1 Tax=Sulfobacillus acidophilus TaxID=53633 RepID=A0A2T2WKG8_9FIRM|nr:MAG: hypothetical protein C7B45_05920 [Sulfobacillus acidophilus]